MKKAKSKSKKYIRTFGPQVKVKNTKDLWTIGRLKAKVKIRKE